MAWDNYGNGEGVYRSTDESSTVWLTAVPDILEELRIGVNERIAITDLAYVAAFETGEGLTFDQAVAAVTALRAKIAALIANTGAYLGDAWPPTTRYTTLASVLGLGSYGSSWLTFERIQDGRIYEQIREAIDAIVVVGFAGTFIKSNTTTFGTSIQPYTNLTGLPITEGEWSAAFAAALPGLYNNSSPVLIQEWWHGYGYVQHPLVVSRTSVIRVALSDLRCTPDGWGAVLQYYASQHSGGVLAYTQTLTFDGVVFAPSAPVEELVVFTNGVLDDTYFSANVSYSLSNVWPWSSYFYDAYLYCLAQYLRVYDRGSTWTKKP